MKRRILLTSITAMLCMWAGIAIWLQYEHVVVRLPSGFFPKVVYAEKGEAIRFINLTFPATWPAAGPHPSHSAYLEFDPQEGIPFLHSWKFTPAKAGGYPFHDHNAPHMTGVLISSSDDISKVSDQSVCTALSNTHEQAACMEIYFRNITDVETYEHAKAIFEDIAARYPSSCHTFAHDLGKNAYFSYEGNGFYDLGDGSSSCGFGLWHGFTTAMQAHRGIEAAKEFCATLPGETELLQSANRTGCYHGIGIGLIPDPPPADLWGKFQPLVDPALSFCDTIPTDESTRYKERCLTGIFHAMTVYMGTDLYGFTYDEKSISLCAQQAPAFRYACFNTLVAELPAYTNFDLKRTVDVLIESVPPSQFMEIFLHAAIIFVDAESPVEEAGDFVKKCDALSKDYKKVCVAAVINKLYNNGIPGSEYRKAIAFCSGSWADAAERSDCFHQVASYSNQAYGQEKMAEACDALHKAGDFHFAECPATGAI